MSSRMRKTRGKTRHRRSHHGVTTPRLSACAHCEKPHIRHRACPHCGHYRDNEVVDMEAQFAKKMERLRKKRQERGEDPDQSGDEERFDATA